jgi:hypothetical protein
VLVICGLKLIYDSSKNNYKNKGLFIGLTIGFIGGTTTLFPFMGLPIYPIGIPLISIYSSIAAYVIVKHRVFDGSTNSLFQTSFRLFQMQPVLMVY